MDVKVHGSSIFFNYFNTLEVTHCTTNVASKKKPSAHADACSNILKFAVGKQSGPKGGNAENPCNLVKMTQDLVTF